MLAVDKLRRVSAALLRHSTLRHHFGDLDLNDTQGRRSVKAVRHSTPPPAADYRDYTSTVVPIDVSHSASLLPVTSYDDVIAPGVTSFGAPASDERRNTLSTPRRNCFDAADAYSGGGTVNVNGVCFSVYGTLCLLYTSPSPRDRQKSRMPSSA